jgi:hypothetical protein
VKIPDAVRSVEELMDLPEPEEKAILLSLGTDYLSRGWVILRGFSRIIETPMDDREAISEHWSGSNHKNLF